MTNKLRIRAKSLNLDLVGEPEYIVRAYDAIHPVLVERFIESVEGVLEDGDARPESMARTMPLHKPITQADIDGRSSEREHVNVVISNEVYNKIHLVERSSFSRSLLGGVVDARRVDRIFINRSQRDDFKSVLPFGKVLWRELTTVGKAVVKGA